MSDDLRTRLADLIYGTVSWRDVTVPVAEEVADAVIAELGLKREETLHSVLPDYDRNTVRANVWATRYVTQWKADDE